MATTKGIGKQLIALVIAGGCLTASVVYYNNKQAEKAACEASCSDGCDLGKEQFNLPQVYVDEIDIMTKIASALEKTAENKKFDAAEPAIIADVRVWKDMQRVKAMFTKEENSVAAEPIKAKAQPALQRLHQAQSKVQFTEGGTALMTKIKVILDGK